MATKFTGVVMNVAGVSRLVYTGKMGELFVFLSDNKTRKRLTPKETDTFLVIRSHLAGCYN